jgi:glycosyltransferase involved in cell wall biosynthesis
MIRIAYLWGQWTGYMAATVSAIVSQRSASVSVLLPPPTMDPESRRRPFDLAKLSQGPWTFSFIDDPHQEKDVASFIERVDPHLVVSQGWNYKGYMKVLKKNRGRFVRALSMDNQWIWKMKQFAGVAASRWLLHPHFDLVFASGTRQRRFASLLGFPHDRIYEGFLSCDVNGFAKARKLGVSEWDHARRFLYAGRLVDDKSIAELVQGYKLYRNSSSMPWELRLIGQGPLEAAARNQEGVEVQPFKQPAELAGSFRESSCFVLPSKYEPWGVVLHEAASAGLPLIAAPAVGSADMFLRNGWNGILLGSNAPVEIARALSAIASAPANNLAELGRRSAQLADTLTPDAWAQTLWQAYDTAFRDAVK